LRDFEPVVFAVIILLEVSKQLILLEILPEYIALPEREDGDFLLIHLERRDIPSIYGRHPV
jgi:hypothetical protein